MKYVKKYIIITLIILGIIAAIGTISLKKYLMENKNTKDKEIEEVIKEEPKEEIQKENIYVDIKGAVVNPGVYEIEENKKVIDVINLAGGLTDIADTSMINLAKKVTNEMVVIIYTKDEVKKWTEPNQIIKYVDKQCICPSIKNDACLKTEKNNSNQESNNDKKTSNTNDKATKKVNINTATLEELLTITGIGESKAKAIIEYRNEKGQFKSIEELKEVSGIGDSIYEKIKDSITI